MRFEDFCKKITDQISTPATAEFGSLGTGLYLVMTFKEGKFQAIGEYTPVVYRNQAYKEGEIEEFGRLCEEYSNDPSLPLPCWSYHATKEGYKLKFKD